MGVIRVNKHLLLGTDDLNGCYVLDLTLQLLRLFPEGLGKLFPVGLGKFFQILLFPEGLGKLK